METRLAVKPTTVSDDHESLRSRSGHRDTKQTPTPTLSQSQARPLPGFDFFLARTRQWTPTPHHGQWVHPVQAHQHHDERPVTRAIPVVRDSVAVSVDAANAGISSTSPWLAAITNRTTWALPTDEETRTTSNTPTSRRSLLRLDPAQVQMNADGSSGFFRSSLSQDGDTGGGSTPRRFLQEHERCEIVLRVLAGERQAHLAKEFGISRAAVHYLLRQKWHVLDKYTKKHTSWQAYRTGTTPPSTVAAAKDHE